MSTARKLPQILLLIMAAVLALLALLLSNETTTIDIHLHDTYYIIGQDFILGALAAMLFFIWLIYLVTNRLLYSKRLTWLHIILTLLCVVALVVLIYTGNGWATPAPKRYVDFSTWKNYSSQNKIASLLSISTGSVVLAQLLFLLNILLGSIKRLRKR